MAEQGEFVVPKLPAWEEKAFTAIAQPGMEIYLAKQFRHDIAWNEYRPLHEDLRTWKAEKDKGEIKVNGKHKTTLNLAIQEGWFAHGWNHPPGSGGADGHCVEPCCTAASVDDDSNSDYEAEEDPFAQFTGKSGKSKKKGKQTALPGVKFTFPDELLKWRFARAAFFAYFGPRARGRLKLPLDGGTGSGNATGMFAQAQQVDGHCLCFVN